MIKEIRKQRNMTQEEMAQFLEISLRQYIRLDNEQALPRPAIFRILIEKLNLSNEEIGIFVRNVISKTK